MSALRDAVIHKLDLHFIAGLEIDLRIEPIPEDRFRSELEKIGWRKGSEIEVAATVALLRQKSLIDVAQFFGAFKSSSDSEDLDFSMVISQVLEGASNEQVDAFLQIVAPRFRRRERRAHESFIHHPTHGVGIVIDPFADEVPILCADGEYLLVGDERYWEDVPPRRGEPSDLLRWLESQADDLDLGALETYLSETGRWLNEGWWDADDLEAARDWASMQLPKLGIDAPSREEFAKRHSFVEQEVDDPEDQRRHQLGFVATWANARLGGWRRFYCTGLSLSTSDDMPPWYLLTEEEYARIRDVTGDPPLLEAEYSGRDSAPSEVVPMIDIANIRPMDAHEKAKVAFAGARYEEVLRYMPKAVDDGSHGLLAQLMHVDALMKLNRTADARAVWSAIADEWISGKRIVWDTQWRRLLEQHRALGLPAEDPRIAIIESKQ